MKAVRLALYFVVGLLLGGVSVLSYAETTPATEGYEQTAAQYVGKNGNGIYADPMAACGTYAGGSFKIVYSASQTWCEWTTGGVITSIGAWCPQGFQGHWPSPNAAPICRKLGLVCPDASWTLSGTTCTRPDCPPGYTRDPVTGACKPPQCPGSGTKSNKDYWGPGAVPNVICGPDNCEVETGFCVGGGVKWACDGGTYTGKNCSGNTGPGTPLNPDGPEKKCLDAGQASGQVNGVTICVPPDTTKNTTNTTKNTTNPSGQTGTTTTTTNTICTGNGSCTSTTTTTNSGGGSSNPGGGSDGTTTTTTAGDKGTYCAEHPGDRVCGGGGGGGNGIGDGLNPPGEEGALDSVEKGVSTITPVNVAGAGGCPADVQLPKGAVFSYAGPCMFAEGMRPIILASAWLLAGLIVLGVARNG